MLSCALDSASFQNRPGFSRLLPLKPPEFQAILPVSVPVAPTPPYPQTLCFRGQQIQGGPQGGGLEDPPSPTPSGSSKSSQGPGWEAEAREKGRIPCLFARVTMLKVSQLGAGLGANKQPPPNEIMNGQQQCTTLGAGRGPPVDKQQGQGRGAPHKQGSQCCPFLRRGSSSPGPVPWAQASPALILAGSVTGKPLPLPQGKAGPL